MRHTQAVISSATLVSSRLITRVSASLGRPSRSARSHTGISDAGVNESALANRVIVTTLSQSTDQPGNDALGTTVKLGGTLSCRGAICAIRILHSDRPGFSLDQRKSVRRYRRVKDISDIQQTSRLLVPRASALRGSKLIPPPDRSGSKPMWIGSIIAANDGAAMLKMTCAAARLQVPPRPYLPGPPTTAMHPPGRAMQPWFEGP